MALTTMSRPMADPLVSTRAMVCGWQSSATKNFLRLPFLSPLHLVDGDESVTAAISGYGGRLLADGKMQLCRSPSSPARVYNGSDAFKKQNSVHGENVEASPS